MTRWWRSHSVRMRLTLWYVAVMIVVLGIYASVVFVFVTQSVSDSLNQQLRGDFGLVSAMVYQTSDGMFAWSPPEELRTEQELPWVQVWSADGRQRLFTSSEADRLPLPESQELAVQADDRIVTVKTPGAAMRVLSRKGRIGPLLGPFRREVSGLGDDLPGVPAVIQVARSEVPMQQELRDLMFILVVGLPLAVAVAGLGGYTLARGALAPIERMTDRAQHITAERLDDRLPVDNPDDEMGRLASVFNETLGRLEASFNQMRRFTADVSHELRTPLTAIRSVGEVGLRGHRDDGAYRSIIGSMLEEADRLAILVDRLLTLSRAETGQATLSLAAVDLHQLVDEVVAHLGVLAEEKGQSIIVDAVGTPQAIADRLTLRQALINLMDNAIKYSSIGGAIRVRVVEGSKEAVIDVTDSGPGIPAEARARVFDRFYRGAPDGEGGTGLGLSIAKSAIEANGGQLILAATSTDGTTFQIRIPSVSTQRRRAAG